MSLISANNISVGYGANTVLNHVSLAIDSGEIITIVGPNGSGKTTLLRALIGAIPPSKGMITRKRGLRVGYIPQKLHIDPTLPITVERFLRLTGGIKSRAAMPDLTEQLIAKQMNVQLSELSGGQLQRVLLARALLNDPEILLLDEATQGLDQPGSAAFYQQIEEVRNQTGCAVLMISHELHVVMSASDRVICLNGHICCEGTPENVSAAPEYRALFGSGTAGALALYRHEHDHHHDHDHSSSDNNTKAAG
jgi:zinc transport system ATP-binding protein